MKYNYVFHLIESDFWKAITSEAFSLPNVRYAPLKQLQPVGFAGHGRWLYPFYRSFFVNRYYSFYPPFLSVWGKQYPRFDFPEEKLRCFLFYGIQSIRWQIPYIKWIRKEYPGSRFVLYIGDVQIAPTKKDLSVLKEYFDLTVAYDKDYAGRYGMLHYPTWYSIIDSLPIGKPCNLFYIGKPKNRYEIISGVYNSAKQVGCNCNFQLFTPASEEKGLKHLDGAVYISRPLSYSEVVGSLKNADCILDVCPKNVYGFTIRVWEALAYGKKLLTNNPDILSAPFYTPEQFSYFKDPSDIDWDFVLSPLGKPDSEYIKQRSPIQFLKFIEERLA